MATKTISLDLEACEWLKSLRRENESFSQTIKRVVRKPLRSDRILRKIRALDP